MACKLRRCARTVLIAFAWVPLSVLGAPSEEATAGSSDADPAIVESAADADLALIEFLGQWETDDGEWMPPTELADEGFGELIETMGSLEIEEID